MIAAVRPRKRVRQNPTSRIASLVNDNIGLAHYFALKYCRAIDHDQALSISMEHLHEAAKTWDDQNGCPFGAYAGRKIKNRLNHYVKRMRRFKRGGDVEKVSMDAPNESGAEFWHSILNDPNQERAYDQLLHNELIDTIDVLIAKLPERERNVIIARFGFVNGKPKTLQQVGTRLNRTRERVRQVQDIALDKLRHMLAKEHFV